jgi:hypothetical protein
MHKHDVGYCISVCCAVVLLASATQASSRTEREAVDRGRSQTTTVTQPVQAADTAIAQPVQVADTATLDRGPASGEKINWQVIAAGGSTGTTAGYVLGSTIGQTAVGSGIAGSVVLDHGFWQDLPLWESCCFGPTLGNLDHSADGYVGMGDFTLMIDLLFITLEPLECMEEANLDQSPDNLVTMTDFQLMIETLFITLAPLPSCP